MEATVSTPAADKRALLAELVRSGVAPFPLSYGQRSLWFMNQLRPEASVAYNMPLAWVLPADVDLSALRRAFVLLVERHASFRTTYDHVRGTPVQRVGRTAELDFRVLDAPDDLPALLDGEMRRRFDLRNGPVQRVVVIRRPADPPVLLWVVHHIAFDYWSHFQLLRELGTAYTAFARGRAPRLPTLGTTYADFVGWQAAMLRGPEASGLTRYWTELLTDAPPLALPTDRPRPANQTFAGSAVPLRLGAELSAKVADLASARGTTPYTVLLAAFQVTVAKAAGQEDFPLGTWTSGRSRPEFSDVVGYFVNPVVLRANLAGAPGFTEVLARAHRGVLAAVEHQDLPFPVVVEGLGVPRDPSRSPLFDVSFTLRASQLDELVRSDLVEDVSPLGAPSPGERGLLFQLDELTLSSFPLDQSTVRFDVEAELITVDGELSGLLRYNTDLFDRATMAWLAGNYVRVLEEVTADPSTSIGALTWVSRPAGEPRGEVGQVQAPSSRGPATDLVDTIIGVWLDVLGREPGEIGTDDDFFAMGGHSLAAIRVAMELQERCGLDISIADVFQHPTPAGLADRFAAPAATGPVPLPRTPGANHPLSYAQEGLWFQAQLAPDSPSYNAPHAFHLTGLLDVDALEWALGQVLARHEALRSSFPVTRDGPVQRIADPAACTLPVVDTDDPEAMIDEEFRRPFSLSAGPLVRLRLYRTAPDAHVLLVLVHHIVFDGWSAAIFWRDLCAAYRARVSGAAVSTEPPAVQMADYAVWERETLVGDRLDQLIRYWRDRLAGPEPKPLPTDFPRPRRPVFHGARYEFDLVTDVDQLCRSADATPHMVYLAAFQVWLAHRTGSTHVVSGSVVAGRTAAETAGVIGHFVNLLPIRTDLTGAATFTAAVRRVRQSVLDAYEHQDLPLTLMVKQLGTSGKLPFGVLFDYQDSRLLACDSATMPGITARRLEPPEGTAQFDLMLQLTDMAGSTHAALEYDTALFRPQRVAAMAEDLRHAVAGWVTEPDQPLMWQAR